MPCLFDPGGPKGLFAQTDYKKHCICIPRIKLTGEYVLLAGRFEQIPGAKLRLQIFIDRKPD